MKGARITPNGDIAMPVAGTIRWVDGKSTGLWGIDHKVVPVILTKDGEARELNALERVLYADILKEVL